MKPYIIRLILTVIILIVNLVIPNNAHAERFINQYNSGLCRIKGKSFTLVIPGMRKNLSSAFQFCIPQDMNVLVHEGAVVYLVSNKNEIIRISQSNRKKDLHKNRISVCSPSRETVREWNNMIIESLESDLEEANEQKKEERKKYQSEIKKGKKILRRLKKCPLNGNNLIIEKGSFVIYFCNIQNNPYEIVNMVVNTLEIIDD